MVFAMALILTGNAAMFVNVGMVFQKLARANFLGQWWDLLRRPLREMAWQCFILAGVNVVCAVLAAAFVLTTGRGPGF